MSVPSGRLAEKWLNHAIKDLKEDPRFAIGTAYNAAELAIKALVLLNGESSAKTCEGLVTQFAKLYVASGEVEKSFACELHEALLLRNKARYDPRAVLTEREAEKVVRVAEKLLERLRKTLQT